MEGKGSCRIQVIESMSHQNIINAEENQSREIKSDFSLISVFLSSLLDSNFSLVRAAEQGCGERGEGREEGGRKKVERVTF